MKQMGQARIDNDYTFDSFSVSANNTILGFKRLGHMLGEQWRRELLNDGFYLPPQPEVFVEIPGVMMGFSDD